MIRLFRYKLLTAATISNFWGVHWGPHPGIREIPESPHQPQTPSSGTIVPLLGVCTNQPTSRWFNHTPSSDDTLENCRIKKAGFGELGPVTNSALLPWRIRTTCLENSAL